MTSVDEQVLSECCVHRGRCCGERVGGDQGRAQSKSSITGEGEQVLAAKGAKSAPPGQQASSWA